MANLVPGANLLTKAQFLDLLASSRDAELGSAFGPIQFRWHRSAGETGPIDGLDVRFSVILLAQFGRKTRVGWGGFPLANRFPSTTPSIIAGNGSGHWQLDDNKCLVPKNGSAAYGTAPPTMNSDYVLTVSDGTITHQVNIKTLANTFHIASKTTGANIADPQLTDVFYSPYNYLVLGDTVVMRTGDYNPSHADWRIGPRATYTGSGRITLTSEIPLGARVRRIKFDSNVSGNISWPIDIQGVDFRVGSNAVSAFVICDLNNGGGHRFYNCNFEVDSSHATPAEFNGLNVGRDSWIIDCKFKNTGQAIKLSNYPINNVITGNDFNGIWGDGCSGHFRNILFKNNFMFNKPFIAGSGAHVDALQHLGILQQVLIGTGDGTTKTFNFTLPDGPIQLTAALKFGDEGSPATCQINGSNQLFGSGIVAASSPINKTTGVGTLTLTFAPPSGQPIYLDYASTVGGVEWVLGTIEDNIVVRNIGTPGQPDTQCFFFDDTYGASRFINAIIRRNVGQTCYANGVFAKFFKEPLIEFNTIVKDILADGGSTVISHQSMIRLLGATGGVLNRNLANGYDVSTQTGLTKTPDPNVAIDTTTAAYAATFASWLNTGLTTRAAVRAAFTPKLNGTAKNADGTYSGAYMPDGSDNVGAVYA